MKNEKRFVRVGSQSLGEISILLDTQTGVQYLSVSSGFGGGVTVLVDKDGKPLLYDVSEPNGTWKTLE